MRLLKEAEPRVAPALPIAAEKPLSVVRMCAGNVSAGRMNVVELGPKLEKKKEGSKENPKGLSMELLMAHYSVRRRVHT